MNAAAPDGIPALFTAFKNKVESRCRVRPLLATPGKGDLPLPAGLPPADPMPSLEQLPWGPGAWAAASALLAAEERGKSSATTGPGWHGDWRGGEAQALE